MFDFKCTVCHLPVEKFVSYTFIQEGARCTKLCCLECREKIHEKWIENGWELVNEHIQP